MPTPTLITELSTTAAANSPAGSDSPSTLDDIQRAHASFIAQLRDRDSAFALTLLDDANAAAARTTLGAAASGANTDITSLTNLTGGALVNGAAGLGYGTGAGGTVTQATSKATAVTLNKPTGKITMNASALASNTAVTFLLNNSLLGVNDVVVATCDGSSMATRASYQVTCADTGSGNCALRVVNISAGSLSEAVAINFAIIKGAAA